ncbi:RsmD family RNA methyltransferase [Deinococcus irradiatisoli]|uniref:RsmD family RNA methyltransferase n=1 Tax=Deinococcus irradiatisoli TaxID=2202254 RepID=UPI00319E7D13
MRILGGVAKGRALKVPDSARPSTARLRKSLFDLLYSRRHEGDSFIDLHGGSGAIGLEAASRGYQVTLIEKDVRAIKALEQSARDLGLRVRVLRGDTDALIGQLPPHDVIFSDPPYSQDIPKLTRRILASTLMSDTSLLIVQHPVRVMPGDMAGFSAERRVYGSNALTLYTRSAAEASAFPSLSSPSQETPGEQDAQDT